jgi:hypothetical protein
MRSLADVLRDNPAPQIDQLPAPSYERRDTGLHVALAVEDMARHMTDEGWQIMLGLERAGYALSGFNLPAGETDVRAILRRYNPPVCVVQDKREWDIKRQDFREHRARFYNVGELRNRPDIFKVTILKDAYLNPEYHRGSAEEMGVHAWVVYYHPLIVAQLAPYVRPYHLIRTYHSLDPAHVPPYNPMYRRGCLFSGAVSSAYPERIHIRSMLKFLPAVEELPHPGYHNKGCQTPAYIDQLTRFKAAFCTTSRWGYALRKIVEATAAGCVVITDLPTQETMPYIDDNLVRIDPDVPPKELYRILEEIYDTYDPARQGYFSCLAVQHYSYEILGLKLAADIDSLRGTYSCS